MNHKFTLQLQEWINTPDEQKNWDEGALLLLQLSGNRIMYHNISVNPKGKAEFIKGKLQQYLKFRLADMTKVEVEEMQKKVDVIVQKVIKPKQDFADFKAGKRGDHDALPDEVKALYVQNLDIIHRMRELHMQLRHLSLENASCPDSERYPFLKEIIALDKQLHSNWDIYDHFVIGVTTLPDMPTVAAHAVQDSAEDKKGSETTEVAPEKTAPKARVKKTAAKPKTTRKKKSE